MNHVSLLIHIRFKAPSAAVGKLGMATSGAASPDEQTAPQPNKVNNLYTKIQAHQDGQLGNRLPKISANTEELTPEGSLVDCSEKLRNFPVPQVRVAHHQLADPACRSCS